MHGGDIAKGRAHLDHAIELYDPTKHRELATRFGQDARAAAWSYRALTLWLLGHSEAALTDVEKAIKDARETSHAATLLYALTCTNLTQIACGNYEAVRAQSNEAIALADEKGGTPFWRAHATIELARLFIGFHRPSCGGSPRDHVWTWRIPVNGRNDVCTMALVIFGERSCGPWPT